jgi:hypothetical protein
LLCWVSNQICWFPNSLKRDTFCIVIFSLRNWAIIVVLYGGVFLTLKFILRAGTRWRIGSGINIPLLNENWLYNAWTLSVQDSNTNLVANLLVTDIILPDEKKWNMPLLMSLFAPSIVQKIANTLLYDYVKNDKYIWHKENDGIYYVCSAYHLCVQELLDKWWLEFNFLWRVCRRCVPTRANLRTQGVNCTTDVCALCNVDDKDSRYIFFEYPSSRNIGACAVLITLC